MLHILQALSDQLDQAPVGVLLEYVAVTVYELPIFLKHGKQLHLLARGQGLLAAPPISPDVLLRSRDSLFKDYRIKFFF